MTERLGQLIRRAREGEGLTQTALANKVGVTAAAVSTWEAGTQPKEDNKSRLEEVLGPLSFEEGIEVFRCTGREGANHTRQRGFEFWWLAPRPENQSSNVRARASEVSENLFRCHLQHRKRQESESSGCYQGQAGNGTQAGSSARRCNGNGKRAGHYGPGQSDRFRAALATRLASMFWCVCPLRYQSAPNLRWKGHKEHLEQAPQSLKYVLVRNADRSLWIVYRGEGPETLSPARADHDKVPKVECCHQQTVI